MATNKQQIRTDLLVKAREILKNKGLDFLTARKLADYSGYSVGTIYNQFKSMDTLIIWENCQTLDELYAKLQSCEHTSDAYKNLLRLADRFTDFVLKNKQLWFTLYNFHFTNSEKWYDIFYLRRIIKIIRILENNIHKLFDKISEKERRVSVEVLSVTLFSLSSLLTTEKDFPRLEKKYVVRLLISTYLAGMSHLSKK